MIFSKKNLTICTLLGNRCTYTRQKVLFELLETHMNFKLVIFLTGSLLENDFRDVRKEIQKKHKRVYNIPLKYNKTLKSMAKSAHSISDFLNTSIDIINPDIFLAIADRWEQLPFAMTAAYLNKPLVHIQGGEVSGNIDDKVRNAISMLSDVHFPTNRSAAERLENCGRDNVFNYGCPSLDLIKQNDIKRNYLSSDYFICMFHPHTKEINKVQSQLKILSKAVKSYIEESGKKCYWFLSNDDPGSDKIVNKIVSSDKLIIVKNIEGIEYLKLLANATFIIGNSSSGIREASYLGVNSINIGLRQEGRITSHNVTNITKFDENDIKVAMVRNSLFVYPSSHLFGNGEASIKIVRKLEELYL